MSSFSAATDLPALLWYDLPCYGELIEGQERLGLSAWISPAPLSHTHRVSMHAHALTQWHAELQGGIIQKEEAEGEL